MQPLRLALLGLMFVHCASVPARDPKAVVQAYLSARTLDEALSVLAPEYRLWFGTRSGEGLDRARAAKMLEWDFALHPRHRVHEITVRGSEVIARVHEDNDFSLLIGFPGWDATSSYTVDANGRISSQLYVPAGPTEWRPYLDAPLAWIREHHPDALPRIFPNDRLAQTRESAREWVTLLRAWRAATGQADPTLAFTLDVDGHRPLSDLAEALSTRDRIVVTYEEERWSAEEDLEDVTHTVSRNRGGATVFAPRRAAVSFAHEGSADDRLTDLLRQYHASGAPGEFRVERSGNVHHIIPSRIRDAGGRWVDASPILSTPVTLADEERTVDDTLDLIVAQLNEASPTKIRWGFVPLNLFVQNRVRIAAERVPAREVMRRIVELLPRRTRWMLSYDPTTRFYYLSFLIVPERE